MTEYNTLAEALDAKKVKTAQGKRQSRHLVIGAPVKALTPEQISAKYNDRRRSGKTEQDHKSGSHRATQTNRDNRKGYPQWCRDGASKSASTPQCIAKFAEFAGSANGQKSRALKDVTYKVIGEESS